MERVDIAIIGTGPAGVSAAITAKVRNKSVLLIGSRELSEKMSKAHQVIGYGREAEQEADYLAEIVGKVHYFPMGKEELQLSDAVEVVHERPKAITGTQTVSTLETDAGSHPVDGVFILRDAIAPSQLVPGLATEENHVKVNLQMETNLPGLFACGDITGKPYQYIKAAGQGNVAALSAAEYLDKKKREI